MGTNIIINDNAGIKASLARIEQTLERIEHTMSVTKADFDAQFVALGAAIQEVANDINDLIARLQTGGLTDAEEQDVFNQLTAATATLTTLGQQWTPPA